MLTVKLLALELGALLVYAAVKGLSVGGLLRGAATPAASNPSVTQ